MHSRSHGFRWTLLGALVLFGLHCAPEYRWCLFDGNCGDGLTSDASNIFRAVNANAFTEVLIQGRTFIAGQVVTTVTHRVSDLTRTPVLVDFNRDGRADAVVGYMQDQRGVVQILLSYGAPGTVQYASLTLDGGDNPWAKMNDVAVGDIDGDGNLDLVIAAQDGVVYLHHPSNPDHTHVMAEWGQATGELELIANTHTTITNDELTALLAQALGPGANLDNYIVTVEQGYTSVELADFNNDRQMDIAATRRLRVSLEPKPSINVEPLEIVAGSIQVLINPGRAVSGEGWTALLVGNHERHDTLDREGARDLRAYDLDGDGDLDLISTAVDDTNVQIAWFENPGGPGAIDPGVPWPQHRIGSVRGAFTIDVVDLTGDGRVDVVATSPTQMQLTLFIQPDDVATRGYDWYNVPIVQFESYEPRAVKAIDVDNDGMYELVVGGTNGAVRYFEQQLLPTDPWIGFQVTTFDPPGDIGLLGYGDLDGDGDIDLLAVCSGTDDDHVSWIRNNLIP
jgi:hypothetical protein